MQNSVQAVSQTRSSRVAYHVALVVGASLFVSICARLSVPLPFTPVPLTLANFAVLVVGLTLGSRAGFAALALYLAEGAMGLPVFSPAGPGGIAQLLGPTGGYLMAYPLVAFVAGFIAEKGTKGIARFAIASLTAEVLLFVSGMTWFAFVVHSGVSQAAQFALYPFVFAEVMKMMAAAGSARKLKPIVS